VANLLITGGAGFIGANFVLYWRRRRPNDSIVVLDALTYAGNRTNLHVLQKDKHFEFVHGDICDAKLVQSLFQRHDFHFVVHFAAESHVDRSIVSSGAFVQTNVGNIRDWLFVEDHCAGIALVLTRGRLGETYNIGGGAEMANIDLIGLVCDQIDRRFAADKSLAARFLRCPAAGGGSTRDLITFVKDRPGHDRRYAICADKLARELGFCAETTLADGLLRTVDWYLDNEQWWRAIQTGAYRDWMKLQYGAALTGSDA
jgi:dTDP-D-glucose 4,6-dehydratase